ncbi:hypothetical protein CPB85DRAFT_1436719 [Mucidula mucida]|nr:hypothetical protein CPB85DRAFT_1436719 [Mucidula mucida]
MFKQLLQPPLPDFFNGQRQRAIIETCMGVLGKAQGREHAQELFKTFCNNQKDQPGWELNTTYAICCDDDVRPSVVIACPCKKKLWGQGCVLKAYQHKKECPVCRTENTLSVHLE